MLIKCIAGATRHLGAPPDWNGKDMSCGVLPVIDVPTPEGNFMVSAWEPTPSELRAMQAGHSINLGIRGSTHPVVFVHVPEAAHFEQDAQPAAIRNAALDVDALANEIRRVDGSHDLGASALAEALLPFLQSSPAPKQEIDHRAGYEKLREFISDFEIDTGEGIWSLNENEQFLIEQFVLELMANDDAAEFIEVRYTTFKQRPFPSISDGKEDKA